MTKRYILNHFRDIAIYFGLPINNLNRPGSIRYDADTIRKLTDIELKRNRRIVSIVPQCPRVGNRTNYNSPHDNTHWMWAVRNFRGIEGEYSVGEPVRKVYKDGFWRTVGASSGPWIGSIISRELDTNEEPPVLPDLSSNTPTPSVSYTPTPTPTPTVTATITPSITQTITPSITPTETACPLATPTPTITPNLQAIDCLLHIKLTNLKPDSIYRSNIEIKNSNIVPKPSEFAFESMNDGTQNLWILLTRVEINQYVPINIVTRRASTSRIQAEEYEADHIVSILFTQNCGCTLPVDCPAEIISVSTDIDTTVNYNGCIICNGSGSNDTITINDGPGFYTPDIGNKKTTVGTVGTLGTNSFYGTYDQSGNVWEWIESGPFYKTRRFLKGGSYLSGLSEIDSESLSSTKIANIESYSSEFGFRIATYTNANDFPCFVDVGDPCNISDGNGIGTVKYNYKIHKYTVTNYDYMTFLNSVSFDQSKDILNLYKSEMEDSIHGGIIRRFNTDKQRYEYGVKPNMAHKPVNFVSWVDAARYCNWLHNLLTTTDTESGAYDLSDLSLLPSNLVTTNSTANIINKVLINNSLVDKNRIWKESVFLQSNIPKKNDRLPSTSDIIVDNTLFKNLKGLSIDLYLKEDIEVLSTSIMTLRWCGFNVNVSGLRITRKDGKLWNIFIPKYLVDKDGGYSLTIGGPSTNDFPNTKKLLLDPIIIFFIVDQDNNFAGIDSLSFEGSQCYRDFGIVPRININIERNHNAKYFLPNNNEWHKAAYYDNENQKYYKYATQSNKMPFCPNIDDSGNGPYARDPLCDCEEIKICDADLIDITQDYYSFSINLTKGIGCCDIEYKFLSATNNTNEWTSADAVIDCLPYDYHYYPPILCADIIP